MGVGQGVCITASAQNTAKEHLGTDASHKNPHGYSWIGSRDDKVGKSSRAERPRHDVGVELKSSDATRE